MHPALTSSQIATASAALAAANSHIIFGTSDFSAQPREETTFAFDCTPSHLLDSSAVVDARRFAYSSSLIYSLSPISDDNPTSAGGASAPPPGGSGDGDDSNCPKGEVGADIVYHALVRIADPKNSNVSLREKGLRQSLLYHGIINWMSDEEWDGMRKKAKRFEGMEATLEKVEKTIEDREAELALLEKSINSRLNRALSFLCKKIVSLTSVIKKVGFLSSLSKEIGSISSPFESFVCRQEAKREQREDIGDELKELRSNKRAFEAQVKRKRILEDLLGRTVLSDYRRRCCILTDKGLKVLKKMKEMDQAKLKGMNLEYFMRLFEES